MCPKCDQAHWTVAFARYIQENDVNFDDGMIMVAPELLMAQTIENLREKAIAKV